MPAAAFLPPSLVMHASPAHYRGLPIALQPPPDHYHPLRADHSIHPSPLASQATKRPVHPHTHPLTRPPARVFLASWPSHTTAVPSLSFSSRQVTTLLAVHRPWLAISYFSPLLSRPAPPSRCTLRNPSTQSIRSTHTRPHNTRTHTQIPLNFHTQSRITHDYPHTLLSLSHSTPLARPISHVHPRTLSLL